MKDIGYICDPFKGSIHEVSINNASREGLNYRLGYELNAIDYHKKEGNPKQVEYFQDAVNLINKRLKLKSTI